MPHSAESDLGLHYLPITFWGHHTKGVRKQCINSDFSMKTRQVFLISIKTYFFLEK